MLFLLIKHPSILVNNQRKIYKTKEDCFSQLFSILSILKSPIMLYKLKQKVYISQRRFYTMYKSFNQLPRLVQFLLLLIPVVNWITEVVVRFSVAMEKKSALNLVIAILVLIFGVVFGWIDCIWVLLFHHLILAK